MRPAPPDHKVIDTASQRARLMAHPLYPSLIDERRLRHFMRSHVFCVWDFQCLLKSLQRHLTCVEVPWMPSPDPEARRLINEIVLDEESDSVPEGGHLSHFELYIKAMEAAGADTAPVLGFLDAVRGGASVNGALHRADIPPGVAAFVGRNLEYASSSPVHVVAAAFTYGREEVIPDMFRQVVEGLAEVSPQRWGLFRYYLERHIEADGETHGPMALALIERLCGDQAARWEEAEQTATDALEARIALWDAIYAEECL